MKRRAKLRHAGVLVALLAVYLLLFPRGTGPELLISADWVTAVDADAEPLVGVTGSSGSEPVFAVRSGNRFAFVNAGGTVLHADEVLHTVSLRDNRYANVSAVSAVTVIQDERGGFVAAIPAEGYPILAEGHTIMMHPDGATLSRWGDDGGMRWNRAFGSVVTDIATGEELTMVGRLDGRLSIVTADGEPVFEYRSRGGRLPVVVAVALDETGSSAAALLDIDPQRLVLFSRGDDGFEPAAEIALPGALRRPGVLRFVERSSLLLWEQPGFLEVWNLAADRRRTLELTGVLTAVDVDGENHLLVAVSSAGSDGEFLLAHPELDGPVLRLGVPGGSHLVRMESGLLLLEANGRLIAYRVGRG